MTQTQQDGSDVRNINWQVVFNHAYDHSLEFEAGGSLSHGRVADSLKSVTTVGSNTAAGRLIQQAVSNGVLKETDSGYKIVCDGPSTGDLRQALDARLRSAMESKETVVIKSPTSSGKTYTPSTTRWRGLTDITGGQPVILFSGTTDARDGALAKSEESWVSSEVLYGRDDTCPLARGDYDSDNSVGNSAISAPDGSEPSEWFKAMCNDRGLHVSVAHDIFAQDHDAELPCSEDGNDCPSATQWTDIPRDENGEFDYDILHATHPFGRVPQLVKDCNVIIDELPDYSLNISTGRLRKTVTSYLDEIDAPVTTWEGLMVSITGDLDVDLDQLHAELETPDISWFRTGEDAHALTPGIVEAIVTADQRTHDRWVGEARYTYPTLIPGHDGPEQEVIIRIVLDAENNKRLLQVVPDFTEARSVIGLDAHPTMPKWRANTVMSMEMDRIVSSEDLHKWRRNQRNLKIIQVGDNKNTWTKKDFSHSKVGILCDELRRKHGDGFRTGITSLRFEDDFRRLLAEAGVKKPDTIHFGNEKSVNNFESEQIGLVAGCISPSDDNIKDWMALLNKKADPAREVDENHGTGQTWIGEDAAVAHELIADVRENSVLQACGRYARSPQDPDDGATVVVLTDVLPDEYVDETRKDVHILGKKQSEILDRVSSHDGVTARFINERTDISKKHIHDTLNLCRPYSWMQVDAGAGSHNADVFYANRSPSGLVDI